MDESLLALLQSHALGDVTAVNCYRGRVASGVTVSCIERGYQGSRKRQVCALKPLVCNAKGGRRQPLLSIEKQQPVGCKSGSCEERHAPWRDIHVSVSQHSNH